MLHTDTLLIMHPLIETHRAELLALARSRGITDVWLFGSMIRGDASDHSDVDLLGRRVDVVTEASLHPALRERVMAGAELL